MEKHHFNIEEFELDKPGNYEEILQNADSMFAELLVRYYYAQNNPLTTVSDNCIIKAPGERKKNEQLFISKRGSGDPPLYKTGSSKEDLERVY